MELQDDFDEVFSIIYSHVISHPPSYLRVRFQAGAGWNRRRNGRCSAPHAVWKL